MNIEEELYNVLGRDFRSYGRYNYMHIYKDIKFISIVITTYCRPDYLRRAIDSIKQYADLPYELVVHDDGSSEEVKDIIYSMSDDISVTILNNGRNMGLNESVNRCVEMALSDYILFMCDDCYLVAPCFKSIYTTLQRPYVGIASPGDPGADQAQANKYGFALTSKVGMGSTFSFRKSVWEEVGGWDLRSTSGQSDNVFIDKILRAGYWSAAFVGAPKILVENFANVNEYKPSFADMAGNDCSLPRLFGLDEQEYIKYNHYRREACQWWVDGERTIPNRETHEGVSFDGTRYKDTRTNPVAGLNDIPYWYGYFSEIFGNKQPWSCDHKDIDWEIAKRHGQFLWKDTILGDFER